LCSRLASYDVDPCCPVLPPLIGIYFVFLTYYRRTSIEIKRLDSVLRSLLYASFTEALTGLGTIRAYKEETRFVRDSEKRLDSENRAYFLSIATQRWLGKSYPLREVFRLNEGTV